MIIAGYCRLLRNTGWKMEFAEHVTNRGKFLIHVAAERREGFSKQCE
jgi:hypothetical protein